MYLRHSQISYFAQDYRANKWQSRIWIQDSVGPELKRCSRPSGPHFLVWTLSNLRFYISRQFRLQWYIKEGEQMSYSNQGVAWTFPLLTGWGKSYSLWDFPITSVSSWLHVFPGPLCLCSSVSLETDTCQPELKATPFAVSHRWSSIS